MVGQNVNGLPYAIKKVLRPDECGIDLLKFYQGGVLQKGWTDAQI